MATYIATNAPHERQQIRGNAVVHDHAERQVACLGRRTQPRPAHDPTIQHNAQKKAHFAERFQLSAHRFNLAKGGEESN